MSSELEKLIVRLIGDTSEFEKQMKTSAEHLQKTSEQFQKTGTALTRGVTLPLVAAGGASIKLASDLAESRNKNAEVFKEMAADMLAFSETSNTALGMTREQVLGYSATFGNLLMNMGMGREEAAQWAKSLVTMTADYASFHNLNPGEAFEKIKAGMVGSAEPLLSLGKDLRISSVEAYALENGLVGAGESMDQLTLAQARLGQLTSQSEAEMGDFARTSEGLANSGRIALASIQDLAAGFGEEMLPVVEDILQEIVPLLQSFNEMDESTKEMIIKFGLMAAAAGPVLKVLGGIGNTVAPIGPALGAAFNGGGAKALLGLVNPATAVAVALLAVVTAAITIDQHNKKVAEGVEKVGDAFGSMLSEAEGAEAIYESWETAHKKMNDEWARSHWLGKAFVPIHTMNVTSVKEMGVAMASTGVSYEEYLVHLEDALVASETLTGREQQMLEMHSDTAYAVQVLAEKYGYLTEAQFTYYEILPLEAGLQAEANEWKIIHADTTEVLTNNVITLEEKIEQNNAAQEEANRLAEEAAAAYEAQRQAVADTAQSYADMAVSMMDVTTAQVGQKTIDMLGELVGEGSISTEDYLVAVQGIGTAFGLMDDESLALAGNLPILIGLFEDGVIPAGEMGTAVDLMAKDAADGVVEWENLLEQLELTPDASEKVVGAIGDIINENGFLITSNENLLTSFRSLKEWADTNTIQVQIERVVTGNDDGTSNFEDRAGGGGVMAGQPYVVNEYGPEVFVSPSGGFIMSRNDMSNMFRGDPVSNGEVVAALRELPARIVDEMSVRT